MTTNEPRARVVGGGLAGCEAALVLANHDVQVELYEMKPYKRTPAQVSDKLAELVCSNSFRSNQISNAVGLIKEEMRRLDGHIVAAAEKAKVPAGDALAVDREVFANTVEKIILEHPNIELIKEEMKALPNDGIATIIATGPLTAPDLASDIAQVCGKERLAFYDAIAPIIDAESVNLEKAYFKSRWDKGDGNDYLNCPMSKEEYDTFLQALLQADQAAAQEFENLHYFEGCLPLEVMAQRGPQTLTYGPLKPVGLHPPKPQAVPHAVLQLRKEDIHGNAYNLVGCQTRLKQPDQRNVFRLIPGLEEVQFLRYGAIHRNTYLDSPELLDDSFRLRATPERNVFFAGQITGVEGYVESTACGLLVGLIVADMLHGKDFAPPPEDTALGGLYRHTRGVLRADPMQPYEPSNVTWAMLPPTPKKKGEGKKERRQKAAERALKSLMTWKAKRSDF